MPRNSGFTIIELMIASVIVAIVMVFTMQMFTVNNRAYVKIDSVVDTQQSVRAIASILERDLRHAGMMVPEAAGVCGVDSTTAPDLVYISDYTAIDPSNALGVFDGAKFSNVTQVTSGTGNSLVLDSLVIEAGTPDPAYDTDGNGVKDSDFRVNGGVIEFEDGSRSSLVLGNGSLRASYWGSIRLGCRSAELTCHTRSNVLSIANSGRIDLRNTRTTLVRWWERLLVAPNYVNYHLEHHLIMTVPHYNLPRLHRLLRDRGVLDGACVHTGYRGVLQLAAGKPA